LIVEIDILEAREANNWNQLIERTPFSSIYHLWEWGTILSSAYHYQRFYLSVKRQGEVIGGLPLLHVKSRLFGNRLISLPFCEYGGPLVDPNLGYQETRQIVQSLLEAAHDIAKTLSVDYVEIRKPVSKTLEELVNVCGYIHFPRYVTFRVDLKKDTKELWKDLHKTRTRKSVKKAMKSGVVATEVESGEQIKAYYRLYLQTIRRHGSPPHRYEFFEKLNEFFSLKGKVRIQLAQYMGKPIGGLITFCHGKTIFDWNSVTDPAYRNLNSHCLLLWSVIEWGVENKYETLDLGRTRRGDSIYDFKSGWGGQETDLSEYVYFLNSRIKQLPDPEQTRYRYISKVWALMPSILVNKIGPKVIGGIAL